MAASAICKWCKRELTQQDDLELYCARCGRRRIPFALLAILTWIAVGIAFFATDFIGVAVRVPFFLVAVLGLTLWVAVLILRHRPSAIRRLLLVVIPAATILMHLVHWGASPSIAWPAWLDFLSTAAALVAWVVLLAYVLVALGNGFVSAREHASLRSGSLILTIFALVGVVITLLHAGLPSLISVLASWGDGVPVASAIVKDLRSINTGIAAIEAVRFQLGAVSFLLVIAISFLAALRGDYRYVDSFRTGRTILRIIRRTFENLWSVLLGTVVRLLLIVRSLLTLVVVLALAVLYLAALYELAAYVRTLWEGSQFVGLSGEEWLLFGMLVLACIACVFAMTLVVSHTHREKFSAIKQSLISDAPGLAKAIGFSSFVIGLGFWLNWLSVIVTRLFVDDPAADVPFRGVLFAIATVVMLIALVVGIFVLKVDRQEDLDGPQEEPVRLRQLTS